MKALLIALVVSLTAQAQVAPPILRLIRSSGLNPNTPYASAGPAIQVLGLRSMTGVGETWLIEQHPTFQSIEEVDKGLRSVGADTAHWPNESGMLEDEVLGPPHTLIAYYREGWGYHAEDAVRMLPRARYFNVTIYRLRPGASTDMELFFRSRHTNLDAVNATQPDLVYHVISGASSDIYLLFAPMVSLRAMDDRVARLPLESRSKQLDAEFIRETVMFRIDPVISYVSDEFAGADRAFWRGN
jgi:hypothetical protein